ncbi:MAG: MATE family efflux transporter [Saccharofermentans sp.]|nr:MATE family efflux transporter [Saccharofermentans sp.]
MSEESSNKLNTRNLTTGSMVGKIITFAIPLAVIGILQQLFNAADVAVVGQYVGKDAMAAVGANSSIINLVVNLFVGISIGSNVVIANSVGKKDRQRAQDAAKSSIVIALIGGVAVAVIGELLAASIVRSMNVPDSIFPMALLYLRIYFAGMPVILLYNFEAAIFRGLSDSRTPLIVLTLSGILNVCLNFLFVYYAHMGVEGVAIATVVSNLTSSVLLLLKLLGHDSPIDLRAGVVSTKVVNKILILGIPAGVQSGIFSVANVIIQTAINGLGPDVMAASSAAYNIEIFVYYILNSFAQTCTTFVGQNYGAGKIDRCRRALITCIIINYVVTGTVVALVLIFGNQLLGIFNKDAEVIAIGYIRLIYIFMSYIFTLPEAVIASYLNGYGKTLPPAALSVIGICATRLVWIFYVFPRHRSFDVIMMAYPISMVVTLALMIGALIVIRPGIQAQKRLSS